MKVYQLEGFKKLDVNCTQKDVFPVKKFDHYIYVKTAKKALINWFNKNSE